MDSFKDQITEARGLRAFVIGDVTVRSTYRGIRMENTNRHMNTSVNSRKDMAKRSPISVFGVLECLEPHNVLLLLRFY